MLSVGTFQMLFWRGYKIKVKKHWPFSDKRTVLPESPSVSTSQDPQPSWTCPLTAGTVAATSPQSWDTEIVYCALLSPLSPLPESACAFPRSRHLVPSPVLKACMLREFSEELWLITSLEFALSGVFNFCKVPQTLKFFKVKEMAWCLRKRNLKKKKKRMFKVKKSWLVLQIISEKWSALPCPSLLCPFS